MILHISHVLRGHFMFWNIARHEWGLLSLFNFRVLGTRGHRLNTAEMDVNISFEWKTATAFEDSYRFRGFWHLMTADIKNQPSQVLMDDQHGCGSKGLIPKIDDWNTQHLPHLPSLWCLKFFARQRLNHGHPWQDKHTSLTASWPFWDGCPIWLEKAIKWYYTIAQFQDDLGV